MIHIAKSLARKLVLTLMLLVVLGAFLIGSMRLLTPAATFFRGELEQWASEQIQRPVRIGGLSARWWGLGPEIVLNSVEIDSPDTTHTTLRLTEIRIGLAILDSLRNLEIKTRLITFSRVKLLVQRHPNGTFTIGGLSDFGGGGGGHSSGLFAIPSRIRLEACDIAFKNQPAGSGPQLFRNVNAMLRNAGEQHQLDADLPLPGGGYLELKADIQGDVSRAGGWNADLYLKIQGAGLANLLQTHDTRGYTTPSGNLNLELWSHWEEGNFHRIQGRGDLAKLLLRREATMEDPAHDLEIERLGGDFLWETQPEGWQLDVRNIALTRNGSTWPESSLSISTRFDDDGRVQLLAGANFAHAGDLAAIARMFIPQKTDLAQSLEKIAPEGELHDLRFEFLEEEAQNRWSLQGRFDSLVTQPWKQIPGVQDLDASFWLSQDAGDLLLNSHSTVLHFPGLFRDPLELKTVQGQISWTQDENGGWRLESPDILAVTRDIRTNTRITLELPAQNEASAFMDLQTDFSDGLAINAHRYYPVGIMPEAVVSWLDRGIVDGRVTSGSALVRGPLRDFPFHKTQNGVFEVFFHTDNMTIDYSPGWPRLNDVAAEVRFLQNGFDVWVEKGTIFDSQLQATHGRITDFENAPFELKGSVAGALQNNLRLLRESPLAEDFAGMTEGMRARGDAVTLIDLTIPIQSGQRFDLDGKIDFTGNRLELQEWQLPLNNIRGELNFTHRKIQARGLKAKALGSNILVDIAQLGKPHKATRITAKAKISSHQIARRFPGFDFTPVTGNANWAMQLDIPQHLAGVDKPPSMRVSSNLRGVSVELPAPFGKTAGQARNLSLSIAFPANGKRPFYLEYGSLLDLALAFEPDKQGGQRVDRGALQVGGERAKIPDRKGMEIGGRLKNLDLGKWTGLLQSQSSNDYSLPLNRLKLKLKRVTAGDYGLDDVDIDFLREREDLSGKLSSRQAEGKIHIPHNTLEKPVRIQLDRLNLNYSPVQTNKRKRSQTTDPTRLPALELEAKKTKVNGKDYGSLQLISRRIPTGLKLQTLSLKARQLQLSATGNWTKEGNSSHNSRLQLSLNTDSLGDLLKDLGYQHYIDRAPAELESQLHWKDAPDGFSPAILNGQISLQIGKGQFLNVNPGIGRVVGLLNIAALQRRLSLDFSDLLNKGLAFDSVEGNFELDNGNAYTNDFQIKGPSAQVDISGRTGLENEDFDQFVTVTPHLSAALPVAGLLAGGPIGGAAMLIAQGLIGKKFDKASKRQYEIKGSWLDPTVTPLSDNAAKDGAIPNAAGTQLDPPVVDEVTPQIETTGFFEKLKKQFTPTRQIHQEDRQGTAPETDH
ncbi:MAG: TIGR02099 family protein [Gammaproteobacteria bacterium]|nr:TIGR02099 family protein [Gammaproteobacteria bacterium]